MMFLWAALSLLILFPSIRGDLTSFHLRNYLDHSISPCSDFYRHVCGTSVHLNETIILKSEKFYKDLTADLNARTRDNPILDDIASVRANGPCNVNGSAYKEALKERCGPFIACYLRDFSYFYDLLRKSSDTTDETLLHFAKYANRKPNQERIVDVTAKIVEDLMKNNNNLAKFDRVVGSYERLLDRLAILGAFERLLDTNHFGVRTIREMVKHIKVTIEEKFRETQWLRETNAFGLDRLSQFLIILDEMEVEIDFDERDANLTNWRRINRAFTAHYFKKSVRTTGCAKFDVLHPFLSFDEPDVLSKSDDWLAQIRANVGYRYNALYDREANSVVLLAPIFYPTMEENSRITTTFAFGAVLAHEVLHPFIKSHRAQSSSAFAKEYACVTSHFKESCTTWGQGECRSGQQTFDEDGPDVEALRVAYDTLKSGYREDELKQLEYEDLGITGEQAFFYAVGVRYCSGTPSGNRHSNSSIRLNGVVSMLPEFTAAFNCKPEDKEYSHEKSTCYLFGPKAGVERKHEDVHKVLGNRPKFVINRGNEMDSKNKVIEELDEVEGSAETTEETALEDHGSGEKPEDDLLT